MIVPTIIDTSLLGISLIVATVLAIAWYDFDRPAHARTWAIGFALLASIWVIEMLARAGAVPDRGSRAIVILIGASASALNTIGFRQRAGKAAWWGALLGAALLPPLAMLALPSGTNFTELLPLDLFNAAMLGIAAATLVGRRRSERAAQRLAFFGLAGLAAVSAMLFALKLVALVGPPDPRIGDAGRFVLPLLPATVTGIGIFTIFLLTADLADQTRRLAGTDTLTGLLNRRGFEDVAQAMLDAVRAGERRATLALIDIDHFKQVNDSFGHPIGDDVLRRFARALTAQAGRRDLLARIGGEEFALLLADTDRGAAINCAERLRRAIEGIAFDLPDRRIITASFGLAEAEGDTLLLGNLLARADNALYRAKETGRNRVVAYAPDEDASTVR